MGLVLWLWTGDRLTSQEQVQILDAPISALKGSGGGQDAPGRAHSHLLCCVETRKIDSQSGKQKLHPSVLALPSLWRGVEITLITPC